MFFFLKMYCISGWPIPARNIVHLQKSILRCVGFCLYILSIGHVGYRKCSNWRPGRFFNFFKARGRRLFPLSIFSLKITLLYLYFNLKPNCNIEIQKPYKPLFANSKRSRKWEASPCDFERTLCL